MPCKPVISKTEYVHSSIQLTYIKTKRVEKVGILDLVNKFTPSNKMTKIIAR